MKRQKKDDYDSKQSEIDEDRKYRQVFLTEEEINEMTYIEEVLEEITKRNIPIYIFPLLTTIDDDAKKQKAVFQYNNLEALSTVENGVYDIESLKNIHMLNSGLAASVVNLFIGLVKASEEYTCSANELIQKGLDCLYQSWNNKNSKVDPVKDYLDKLNDEKEDND